jgi:hypothetical protein
MKRDDGISTTNKEHNNASFLLFSIARMSVKESFVEKFFFKCKEKLQNLKKEK